MCTHLTLAPLSMTNLKTPYQALYNTISFQNQQEKWKLHNNFRETATVPMKEMAW